MSGLHESPAAGPNPMLDAFHAAMDLGTNLDEIRAESIARFGFAIPSDEALEAIARCSPHGVVEVGAGTGYWAAVLQQRGVDVVAFDIEPAPSSKNPWFAGAHPWHPVDQGDHHVVEGHSERTLLIVWPTKNEIWAAAAAEEYHAVGGQCLVFVGEGPGGRTGDDAFHAVLGELTSCVQCEYGSMTSPCICDVVARWRRTATIELPQWPGFHDDLQIYARETSGNDKRQRRSWARRAARV